MKNRIAIVLVFVIFGAPVIIATLLHTEWIQWQPSGGRNHGELISPVIPLPAFSTTSALGEAIDRSGLEGRWQLVHWRLGRCDEACLDDLYWLRQVRRAQDRHQPDVGLVLISATPIDPETLQQIEALADDFVVIQGQQATELLQAFPSGDATVARYITDPMANIILRYPADADPNGIRRDLRRLLTWTQRN